jgi:hypothetical protein
MKIMENNSPDYNFEGFRIEFNEKIFLIPLESGEDSGLGTQGHEHMQPEPKHP